MAIGSFYKPTDPVSENRQEQGEGKYSNETDIKAYNIGTYEYPLRLREEPDLQHYIAFYINVREKSRMTESAQNANKNYTIDPSSAEGKRIAAQEKQEGRRTVSSGVKISKVAKENAGKIVAGGTALYQLGRASGILDAVTGVLLKAPLAGVAAQAVVNTIDNMNIKAFAPGNTLRLKEVITLHLEERPTVRYGVNYSQTDISALAGILMEGSAAATTQAALDSFGKEATARFLTTLAQSNQLSKPLSDIREIATRTRTNPFRETLFESVSYRSFSFRHRFFPKNATESKRVDDIIKMFKIHMYPELTENKLFYIYPSEFDIEYRFKDSRNKWLHKFAKCALTDMQVEYGGDQFVTFENGAPAEIAMTLTFTELEQLDNFKIKDGY